MKDSEAYHRPTGSKYLEGSSSAPYYNSRYATHMVVMEARTQQTEAVRAGELEHGPQLRGHAGEGPRKQ